ncbi:MAG: hypothetical protein PHU85_16260, partial [Phycisphaerae bacterium]|nr:hypothetical protein [Phycisphaerae bacterium]
IPIHGSAARGRLATLCALGVLIVSVALDRLVVAPACLLHYGRVIVATLEASPSAATRKEAQRLLSLGLFTRADGNRAFELLVRPKPIVPGTYQVGERPTWLLVQPAIFHVDGASVECSDWTSRLDQLEPSGSGGTSRGGNTIEGVRTLHLDPVSEPGVVRAGTTFRYAIRWTAESERARKAQQRSLAWLGTRWPNELPEVQAGQVGYATTFTVPIRLTVAPRRAPGSQPSTDLDQPLPLDMPVE